MRDGEKDEPLEFYCPFETRADSDGYCNGENCGLWSKNLQGCSIQKQAEATAEIAHYLKEYLEASTRFIGRERVIIK